MQERQLVNEQQWVNEQNKIAPADVVTKPKATGDSVVENLMSETIVFEQGTGGVVWIVRRHKR